MPQPNADDPVKVDSKHYKVEFENDRVRVVRIKYGPGEKSVMHSHPESISIFLTEAHAKFTYPDGRTENINANAVSVLHMDAFTHLPESTSKAAFEVIQVELKLEIDRRAGLAPAVPQVPASGHPVWPPPLSTINRHLKEE
jgi:hypothetical protein